MKRFFCVFLVAVIVCFSFSSFSFAFTTSTYSDLAQSSTQSNNLISVASNYLFFSDSEFVVAQIGPYEYRIFWGDLKYNGTSVTGNNVNYIQYIREGSGYDYQWYYRTGTDSTLSLSVNHLVVSNISQLGSRSALYEEYHYYDIQILYLIFILAILIVGAFLLFRSVYK